MKIIISGTTGVGKSTTVELLQERFKKENKKVIVLGELVVDSPYFDLYFKDLTEWGFLAQLDFLFERFKQFLSAQSNYNNEDTIVIYDRHFIEDKIFAELQKIKDSVPEGLRNVYNHIYKQLIEIADFFEKPDYFILLKSSYDTVLERMNKRGRDQEKKFENAYWQDLYYRYYSKKSHRDNFKKIAKNFREIDTDELSPSQVIDFLMKQINKKENKNK